MRKRFIYFFDEPGTDPAEPEGGNQPAGDGGGDDGKKYTDADIDRIVGEKFKKWQKQQEKAVSEAKRLAEMSAQERAEAERDALQKELDELKAANARAEMEKTVRSMLSADGISIPDDLVATLVRDDADATSAATKAFAKVFKASVQAGVTAQLAHKQPAAGTGAGTLTKEDILKVQDPLKRQKLIKQNMRLFTNHR